jgi:hypothetical protein
MTVRCATIRGDGGTCTGIATHTLDYSERNPDTGEREPVSERVCQPCGESYTRRPALQATIRPIEET